MKVFFQLDKRKINLRNCDVDLRVDSQFLFKKTKKKESLLNTYDTQGIPLDIDFSHKIFEYGFIKNTIRDLSLDGFLN